MSYDKNIKIHTKKNGFYIFSLIFFLLIFLGMILLNLKIDVMSKTEHKYEIKPVVTFDTFNDENKESPKIRSEGLKLSPYEEGFIVEWTEGSWRAMEWKLKNKNYENRYKYLFYFKGRAEKKGIFTINFIDNKDCWISLHIKITPKIIERAYIMGNFKDCLIETKKNGVVTGVEVKDADYFGWDSIERVSLTNYYEDSGSMKIWCEKMMLFRIYYE